MKTRPENHGRPTCYCCFRPCAHCICSLIESFTAHCDILVLQHPHERRKYHGSAKLVTSAIRNATLLRGIVIPEEEFRLAVRGRAPVLLFPCLRASPCEEVVLQANHLLIALDGTWSEARKIYNRNPYLHNLPALSFAAKHKSNYRIRKQPKPGCLSTVESIAYALLAVTPLEKRESFRRSYLSLLEAFASIIDRQLQYFPRMLGA